MTKLTFAPDGVRRVIRHMTEAKEWSQGWIEKQQRGRKRPKPQPQLMFVHDEGVYLMSNGLPRDIIGHDPSGAPTRAFAAYATGLDPNKHDRMAVWELAREQVGGDDFVEWLDLSPEQIALALSDDFAGLIIDVTADSLEVIFLGGKP